MELADQLRSISDQVNFLIQRQADRLSTVQLEDLNEKMNQSLAILSGDVQRPPVNKMIVRGDIEGQVFSLDSTSLNQLHAQCTGFVNQKNLAKADDIRVSINLGPLRELRNQSSYWTGSFEICQQILGTRRN